MMRIVSTQFKQFSTFLSLMLLSFLSWSQDQSPLQTTLRYINDHKTNLNLVDDDFKDFVVSDMYVSTLSKATMIYLNQRYKGIKIQNAIFNAAISKDGKLVHSGNRFISNIADKINATDPNISAEEAVGFTLKYLNLNYSNSLSLKERESDQRYIFHQGKISNSDVPVQLQYINLGESLKLVWEVQIDMVSGHDFWSIQVDATNGEILKKQNLVIKCQFDGKINHQHNASCHDFSQKSIIQENINKNSSAPVVLGGNYRVFAEMDANGNVHPHENPNIGGRNLLTNIENTVASPYGWHDTDGISGAEYTITRGNNAHAYLDVTGTNIPQGDEPNGGNSLNFDFPLVVNNEPETFEDAAVTNAFFMVNYLHDFSYMNGFDEVTGNFQQNNYGNGGAGGDYVNVEIHDGSGINNATIATPGDGSNPRMQIFLWNSGTENLLTVNAPNDIIGTYSVAHPNWGAQINDTPISGEVVLADDGTNTPTFSCESLVNAAEMNGKVALIDRGSCEFGAKVINAQEAGAVGAIICNFEDNLTTMGPGLVGDNATIPVVMLAEPDCTSIRGFIGNGLTISFVEPPGSNGPNNVSGSLDNGVFAHEFGHGISLRIVGGPANTTCLNNQEHMGEGISDFITLATTVKPGDNGEMQKTIGTYVNREEINGRGLRRYPYTTDMSINPFTYKDIEGGELYIRGSVWASTLWDMYWFLVDDHGFDPDLIEGNGGNNIAVRLVIEGMKLTECSPGFIESRDAILAADELLYNSANFCTIWKAFTRRGMGIHSNQHNPNDGSDGIADFTPPGTCSKDVRMTKTVSETVIAGDLIDVKIEAVNFKDNNVTGVVITDEIPVGTTVVPGSNGIVSGNIISFNIGEMASLEEIEINYQLQTDPSIVSISTFKDDVENGDSNWDIENLLGNNIWGITNTGISGSGEYAWFVPNNEGENEQTFFLFDPIEVTGTQPILRFYHWFDTQTSVDGGIVEISTNGGAQWEQIGDKMFRNGYPHALGYQTFAIPFLSAFSGKSKLDGSNDLISTYIDLSGYLGQSIQIRFRFGANTLDSDVWGENIQDNYVGWYVDDIEMLDMKNYEGEACLTTNEGDNICDSGILRGTIVQPEGYVSTNDPLEKNMEVKIYPNPANDIINLQVLNNKTENANIQILTVDGKEMLNRSLRTSNGLEFLSLNVSTLPAGMYFVKVSTSNNIVVEKITIN